MASLLSLDLQHLEVGRFEDDRITEDAPITFGPEDLSNPQPWIWLLEWLYRFRGYIDVTAFLLHRPEVVILLFEVFHRVCNYFGARPQMVLEIYRDPESPEADEQLFILIQTTLPVPEAMARLKDFDYEWWLGVPRQTRQHVVVDVEFV
ncbi:MAG TPA: hypothetical protein VF282_09085 [Bacillota bacterium]